MKEPTRVESPTTVFVYIPNIIGYIRIVTLFTGFYFSLSNYKLFLGFYMFSFGLDVIDGFVARTLNQTSKFGAALDMLADKFSTPGLLLTLSHLYPSFTPIFTVLLILDVTSHYFHLYSTLLRGVSSHKIIDKSQHFLLRLFYGNKKFFGWTCLGHELFLILLYMIKFYPGPLIPNPLVKFATEFGLEWLSTVHIGLFQLLACLCAPSFVSKSLVHVVQLLSAVTSIAEWDLKHKIN